MSTDDDNDLPVLPPQLVGIIEETRQAYIASTRSKLDALLKMDPLTFISQYDIEVFGDIAETICGARACRISREGSSYRWMVSWQGANGYTEQRIHIKTICEAFDPDRVNDKKRLNL